MIELVLVRHAQPDWEPGGLAVDHPVLTALGRAQAIRTAQALGGDRFDRVYVSPLTRALETCAPIAAQAGVEPTVLSWLRELELPSLSGKTTEDVQTYFQSSRLRELEEWWGGLPGGGESFRHFYDRVVAGIEDLLSATHGARVHARGSHRLWQIPEEDLRLLVVAHEGTNALILSHLLGIEEVPWAFIRFSSDWAGITRLRTIPVASGYIWRLVAFNRIAHLEGIEG